MKKRIRLNEKTVRKIVENCVMGMLNESIFENGFFEGSNGSHHKYGGKDSDKDKKSAKKQKKDNETGDSKLRDAIEKICLSPAVDAADIAYTVKGCKHGDENEKGAARSVFYKQLKHEEGGNGTPLELDAAEVRKTVNALNAKGIKV